MSNAKKAAVTELKAFYASSKKSAGTFVRERDFYCLSYRYNGKTMFECNGERVFSESGSITFVPKGVSYYTEITADMQMAVIHFKLDSDIEFRNVEVIDIQDAGMRLLFEKIIRNFHVDEPVDFSCMSTFYELLAKLEGITRRDGAKQPTEKIRAIREYIEHNYRDQSLYVEAIARNFGISTSYLRREFSQAYGISPIDFLRAVRVGNAKNMLESGCLSIGEIAEQCGFSSTSYFIQVFHKVVGESPNRYRGRIQK